MRNSWILLGLLIFGFVLEILKKKKMYKKISKNFYWWEMFVTNTGLDNEPPKKDEKRINSNLKELVFRTLQPVRDLVGRMDAHSGYRSPKVNKKVGGVSNSQHAQGQAFDFDTPNRPLEESFEMIKNSGIPFDQLILERGKNGERWIHISYGNTKLKKPPMVANWNHEKNKMDYIYV